MSDRVGACVVGAIFATVTALAGLGLTAAEGKHAHAWLYLCMWPVAWLVFSWELWDLRKDRRP